MSTTPTKVDENRAMMKALVREYDPDGTLPNTPGAKLDGGKPDASLLLMFGKALAAVAEVGTFGAKKYSRGGWLSVSNGYVRYTAALLRHLFKGEYTPCDKDSGLLHDAHAAWNALARLELRIREMEDTRLELKMREMKDD